MIATRSTITLYPGDLEIERTLLVESDLSGNISNVWVESDDGGTVEITGVFSTEEKMCLAEHLRL